MSDIILPPSPGKPKKPRGSSAAGGDSSGSSSGSSGSSYEAMQRKANRKAAQRYVKQAQTLQQQADSLLAALGKGGFRAALRTRLGNIRQETSEANAALLNDYRSRIGTLDMQAEANDKDAGSQTYANLSNAGRERANALSELMLQGAGESDVLRAQGMALRNWNANQNEVNRAFNDTQTSIDASAQDLTTDTRSARINVMRQANADRDLAWTSYYSQAGETQTQLGNIYGQMADYYSSAQEMAGSKKTRRRLKRAQRGAEQGWDEAAEFAGMAYDKPAVPARLRDWEGQQIAQASMTQGEGGSSGTDLARPEGATLRRWDV